MGARDLSSNGGFAISASACVVAPSKARMKIVPASALCSRRFGLANAVLGKWSAVWRFTRFSFARRCCSAALLTYHFVRQFLVGLCCAASCRYARSQSGCRECGAPNPSFKRTSLTGRRLTQTLGARELLRIKASWLRRVVTLNSCRKPELTLCQRRCSVRGSSASQTRLLEKYQPAGASPSSVPPTVAARPHFSRFTP